MITPILIIASFLGVPGVDLEEIGNPEHQQIVQQVTVSPDQAMMEAYESHGRPNGISLEQWKGMYEELDGFRHVNGWTVR